MHADAAQGPAGAIGESPGVAAGAVLGESGGTSFFLEVAMLVMLDVCLISLSADLCKAGRWDESCEISLRGDIINRTTYKHDSMTYVKSKSD